MHLNFPEEESIKAKDFSYFLYYFSSAYTVAVEKYADISDEDIIDNIDYYLHDFKNALYEAGTKSPYELRNLFFKDLGNQELLLEEISKHSPLSIFSKGVISALVLSAIISGGKVEGFGVKVEMKPLGEGIRLLKDAFKQNPEPEPKIENNNTPSMGM